MKEIFDIKIAILGIILLGVSAVVFPIAIIQRNNANQQVQLNQERNKQLQLQSFIPQIDSGAKIDVPTAEQAKTINDVNTLRGLAPIKEANFTVDFDYVSNKLVLISDKSQAIAAQTLQTWLDANNYALQASNFPYYSTSSYSAYEAANPDGSDVDDNDEPDEQTEPDDNSSTQSDATPTPQSIQPTISPTSSNIVPWGGCVNGQATGCYRSGQNPQTSVCTDYGDASVDPTTWNTCNSNCGTDHGASECANAPIPTTTQSQNGDISCNSYPANVPVGSLYNCIPIPANDSCQQHGLNTTYTKYGCTSNANAAICCLHY